MQEKGAFQVEKSDSGSILCGEKGNSILKKTVYIHTLGCRLNSADSALLVSRLSADGYEIVDSAGNASLIVVNSCTVTGEAARKSRQAVRKFRQHAPEATIVVTGCSAELDREAFLADGAADLVLTNPEKREIVPSLDAFLRTGEKRGGLRKSPDQPVAPFAEHTAAQFPFRSRAFLKIQEGCNNFCSYCIVPYARGPERSRSFDEVLADCRHAIEAGYPELVLTGVNTCAYCDGGRDLGVLVHAVAAIDGAFRIRLSSTEPHPANRSLLDVMASEPRVCRFLHLALQSGCDRTLRAMNRHYCRTDYAEFVAEARKRIPGIHIGSDLIVGFPGETNADFAESLAFVESMQFSNLHVFTYSPRDDTPAASFPGRVPVELAKERHNRMQAAADRSKRRFAESQLGQTLPVIFETVDRDGFAHGWSDNYLAMRLPAELAGEGGIRRVPATYETLTLLAGDGGSAIET